MALVCELAGVLRQTHFAPAPIHRAVLQMKQGCVLAQRSPRWNLQPKGVKEQPPQPQEMSLLSDWHSTLTPRRRSWSPAYSREQACLTEAPVVSLIPAGQGHARLMTPRTATCTARVKREIPDPKPGKGSCDAEARAPGVTMR